MKDATLKAIHLRTNGVKGTKSARGKKGNL
jgi:hypothetical protein